MKWKDYNGNEHVTCDSIALKMQQPDCKYILPCGLCSLFSDLKTCSMLMVDDQKGPDCHE